jgi:hypothetical protein
MEAAYAGVHLWALGAQNAGTLLPHMVRAAMRSLSLEGPGATLRMDPSNNHAWKMSRLGQIGAGNEVSLLASSEQLEPPVPFPGPRTRLEWDAVIRRLYEEWGGSWSNPRRPEPGKAIDIP